MYIIISNIYIILVVIIKAGCSVAQYIYSSPARTVLSRFPFILLYTYIPFNLRGEYCTFTPLHLSDSFGY